MVTIPRLSGKVLPLPSFLAWAGLLEGSLLLASTAHLVGAEAWGPVNAQDTTARGRRSACELGCGLAAPDQMSPGPPTLPHSPGPASAPATPRKERRACLPASVASLHDPLHVWDRKGQEGPSTSPLHLPPPPRSQLPVADWSSFPALSRESDVSSGLPSVCIS